MRAHQKAATPECRKALAAIEGLPFLKDFYLAGGTALALRLGHRLSVDLDFFSRTNALGFAQREALKAQLKTRRPIRVQEEKDGTIHMVLEETALSFFRYDYPLLKPASVWRGIRLASLEDIALMKLGAIAGRGARKDFIDLYAICRKLPLPRLLKLGDKKFRDSRDFAFQALKALSYFADAEKDPAPEMLTPVKWPEIKAYFERQAPKAARGLLSSR